MKGRVRRKEDESIAKCAEVEKSVPSMAKAATLVELFEDECSSGPCPAGRWVAVIRALMACG